MTVPRFDIGQCEDPDCGAEMEVAKYGDYVLFGKYKALRDELEAVTKTMEKITASLLASLFKG